jgi:Domain of unknown function (DUF4292)
MNKYTVSAFLLIVSCCFASCNFFHSITHRKGHVKDSTSVALPVDSTITPHNFALSKDTMGAHSEPSAESLALVAGVKPYFTKRLNYKTFKGKAKMHYDGPDQKQEFTAHFRVQKDSIIWINITALSGVVQVARILVTPDSLFMINVQDQEYTKISLAQIGKILPAKVDFSALQNFIVGDPLRDGEIRNVVAEAEAWSFDVEDAAYSQSFRYNKTDSTLLTSVLRTHDATGPRATTQYRNYLQDGPHRVSSLREVNIVKGNETYSLDMNFQKVDFDEPLEFPFSIPDSYTPKQQ